MARPIKETPVLKGKEARNFEEVIQRNATTKIPAKEYKKAITNYNRFIVKAS